MNEGGKRHTCDVMDIAKISNNHGDTLRTTETHKEGSGNMDMMQYHSY